MNRVRIDNDLEQWILFFLEGIIETSKKSKLTFEKILIMRESFEKSIATLGRKSESGRSLLAYLFSDPIVKIKDVEKYLEVSYAAANNLVDDFVELGILKEKTGSSSLSKCSGIFVISLSKPIQRKDFFLRI